MQASVLRRELTTTIEALQVERDKVVQLEGLIEAMKRDFDETSQRRSAQLGVERKRYEDQLSALRKANAELFTRHNVEAMTRPQLISLIEEAVNEARRKGMVEAEGLMTRHTALTRTTDLELMRGVVREYQERIAALEQQEREAEERAKSTVKLDTRLLAEKLMPAGQMILTPKPHDDKQWWRVDANLAPGPWWTPRTPTAQPARPTFKEFDAKAEQVAAEAKAKKPRTLTDGQKVTVEGTHGGAYILMRRGPVYSCTCPSWHWNGQPVERRTCKHLEKYLGEKAEADRISQRPKCHCGIELVRGQCQVHTRDWKGSEECECGRAFASCRAAYDTLSVVQRRKGHQPRLSSKTVLLNTTTPGYNTTFTVT